MRIKEQIIKHKSLAESFLSLSVLNAIEVLLPLVTLPYILRVVGAANYGIYSYVFVIIQYLLLLNNYGFNFSATKQVSQHRNESDKLNQIYTSVTICRILLFIGGVLFILAFSPFILKTMVEKLMFLLGLGIVIGAILNPIWLYQGMEKMRYMTIVNVSSRLLFTILIFVFIRKAEDYIYIILYYSLGSIIAGILSLIIAHKQFKVKFIKISWNDIWYQFKDGFAIFCSTIGMNAYRNANVFILKFFVTDAALGIYAAAEKIIKGMQLIITPIAQSLFPHMSQNFKNQGYKQSIKQLRKATLFFSCILLLATGITFACAKWLVLLLCGDTYLEAINIVRIMSFVIFFGGLNYMLGIVGLINLGESKMFMYSVIIAGICSIIMLVFMAGSMGITAGAITMVAAEFVLLIGICVSFLLKRIRE